MNTKRTAIIVAVLLAIGTAWLTTTYLRSFQAAASAKVQLRKVFIATKDIPARAPIDINQLTVDERPANGVDPDAISDASQMKGAISLISIPAGSLLTASKVGHPADVGLAIRLKPGLRAISIAVDRVKDVSGLVEAGDRVDIIADVPRGQGTPPRAATIMRGILVLAVGSALETASATPSPDSPSAATVTLAVTPKQADLLTLADNNTALRLTLRSPRESVRSEPVEAINLPGLDAPVPLQMQPSAPTAIAAAPVPLQQPSAYRDPPRSAPHSSNSVTVIEGAQVTP